MKRSRQKRTLLLQIHGVVGAEEGRLVGNECKGMKIRTRVELEALLGHIEKGG